MGVGRACHLTLVPLIPPFAPTPTNDARRIDFYDELRKRIVEIKVSDYDGMSAMHEVQTLLYALLFGRGWKPTRQFELVGGWVDFGVGWLVRLKMVMIHPPPRLMT